MICSFADVNNLLGFAGGDIGRVGDKKATRSGDSYKVLLIDDERHTEELGKAKKEEGGYLNEKKRWRNNGVWKIITKFPPLPEFFSTSKCYLN